jgi:hypothetical protein
MNMIGLVITICTILIIIIIFVTGYIIECHIKDLKNELTKQEIVDYINSMPVYVRDEKCRILKHYAHICALNSDDYTKIIIDVNKKRE